jgi:hypothetical protein
MRRVRLQEEPVPWYGFEPPSLSVAKPLHHTREPKVGSRVGIQPEFDCGLVPIETMEMDTLQGIGALSSVRPNTSRYNASVAWGLSPEARM